MECLRVGEKIGHPEKATIYIHDGVGWLNVEAHLPDLPGV